MSVDSTSAIMTSIRDYRLYGGGQMAEGVVQARTPDDLSWQTMCFFRLDIVSKPLFTVTLVVTSRVSNA